MEQMFCSSLWCEQMLKNMWLQLEKGISKCLRCESVLQHNQQSKKQHRWWESDWDCNLESSHVEILQHVILWMCCNHEFSWKGFFDIHWTWNLWLFSCSFLPSPCCSSRPHHAGNLDAFFSIGTWLSIHKTTFGCSCSCKLVLVQILWCIKSPHLGLMHQGWNCGWKAWHWCAKQRRDVKRNAVKHVTTWRKTSVEPFHTFWHACESSRTRNFLRPCFLACDCECDHQSQLLCVDCSKTQGFNGKAAKQWFHFHHEFPYKIRLQSFHHCCLVTVKAAKLKISFPEEWPNSHIGLAFKQMSKRHCNTGTLINSFEWLWWKHHMWWSLMQWWLTMAFFPLCFSSIVDVCLLQDQKFIISVSFQFYCCDQSSNKKLQLTKQQKRNMHHVCKMSIRTAG